MELSSGHFQPEEPNDWRFYPMRLGRRRDGEGRLVVSIPVEDVVVEIGLDMGAGPGLILTEKRKPEILRRVRILRQERNELAIPGRDLLPCRKITLERLSIAGMVPAPATVSVTGDDHPFGPDDLTLGMGYFRDTSIVLDLQHQRLWIRNRSPLHP